AEHDHAHRGARRGLGEGVIELGQRGAIERVALVLAVDRDRVDAARPIVRGDVAAHPGSPANARSSRPSAALEGKAALRLPSISSFSLPCRCRRILSITWNSKPGSFASSWQLPQICRM